MSLRIKAFRSTLWRPTGGVGHHGEQQLGRLPNAGRQWRPKGEAVRVEDHSSYFIGPDVEVAIPFGVYDIANDSGWVNVGTDHDTSVFVVESVRRWWRSRGCLDNPAADRLLITADCGGIQQLPVSVVEGRARHHQRRGDRPRHPRRRLPPKDHRR